MSREAEIAARSVAAAGAGFVAGGPAGALIAVATQVVPEIVRSLAGDSAGTVAASVAGAVQTAAGTDNALAAAAVLSSDPAKALELRTALLSIQVAAEERRRADELEFLRVSNADVEASRQSMRRLAEMGHNLAWMPAFQTMIVGVAFIGALVALFAMVFFNIGDIKSGMREILVMVLGILAGEFKGACQFWIGGSRAGSLAAMQNVQASAPTITPTTTAPRARRSLFSAGG